MNLWNALFYWVLDMIYVSMKKEKPAPKDMIMLSKNGLDVTD